MKDSLVSKQPTTVHEFKTRLDVYHYRNNYEFEGNLLKQSFMDNYGQLIKMYEQLKEEAALDKHELAHASAMLKTILGDKDRLGDVTRKIHIYREQLEVFSVELQERYYKLQKLQEQVRSDLFAFKHDADKKDLTLLRDVQSALPSWASAQIKLKANDSITKVVYGLLKAINCPLTFAQMDSGESKADQSLLPTAGEIERKTQTGASVSSQAKHGSSQDSQKLESRLGQVQEQPSGQPEGDDAPIHHRILASVNEKYDALQKELQTMFKCIEDLSNHVGKFEEFIFESAPKPAQDKH